MPKRPYDSTVARMAGNIAAGIVGCPTLLVNGERLTDAEQVARYSVLIARAIVAETQRTEPREEPSR